MKSSAQLYVQLCAVGRAIAERQRHAVLKADPATLGNPTLVHNWGNDGARAAVSRYSAWQARADSAFNRLYRAALHYEHRDRAGRYLWCSECQAMNKMACVGV